jgi:hypothetical protein
MDDLRILRCEASNGKGRTFRSWDDAPIMCQWCDGTLGEVSGS